MTASPRSQHGVLLLEVLIALLIFALGVLGLIGLQARAARDSAQTKYRADATLLANDLLGQMRLTSRDYSTLNTAFASTGSGGARYNTWKARVAVALPGTTANPPTVVLTQVQPLPAIVAGASVTATGLTSSSQVTITVFWKAPSEAAADPAHQVVLVNEIR